MRYLPLLFICCLFAACQEAAPIGAAQPYFPAPSLLQKGIANKYYFHYKPTESYDTRTNIIYQLYQTNPSGQLVIKEYDAGFQIEEIDHYSFEGSKMILEGKEVYSWQGDTIDIIIGPTIHSNWQGDTATIQRIEQWQWGSRTITSQQLASRDTIVISKPAKVFTGTTQIINEVTEKEETRTFDFEYLKIYVEGIGLFYFEQASEDAQIRMELVEQIPLSTFSTLANHDIKRVAYINPKEVLDSESDFRLCDKQSKVADYYNGTPNAGFDGGKGALKRQLLPNIEASKLGKESGYLTFRFVINCKGEIGWFVTEQADLNYQEKEFPKDLVQHIYQLIAELDTWHPTIIREEARDAYAYLTIKLQDGEIIDFLP